MDAVLHAPAATVAVARTLPVTVPTVLIGAACIALAIWLAVISRSFRSQPPSRRKGAPSSTPAPEREGRRS